MELAPQVDVMVGSAAPAAMATERLEAELVTWAARLAAGMAHWLAVLAEYDRRAGYEAWGCATAVRWLSWQCGLDPRAAREHLRVARALEVLPTVQAAMASGELSFSRVRAITRVAIEATEEQWVEVARHSTAAQLERAVRATRRARVADDAAATHAARSLHWTWDDDGSLIIRGRLPADAGAALIATLAVLEAQVPAPEPECDDPLAARRADALVALIEGRADDGNRDGAPPAAAHVVVHTTPAGLAGAEGGALSGGPAVAGTMARRLACDATVGAVDEHGWASRRTRLVRGRLRRRLRIRDQGCRWPGCGSQAHLHAHHVRHWAHGGATRPDNLVLLCGPHHRLVHDGGYGLAFAHDDVSVTRPDGRPLERLTAPPHPASLPPARQPPANGWDGSALGLHDLVEGVLLLEAAAS